MKGLDDGPDGLNDAAFERALGGKPARRKRPTAPAAVDSSASTTPLTADRATEIVLHAIALADSVGVISSLMISPSVAPDALLAWADRSGVFVGSEEMSRVSSGVTIRWTLYSVTLPGGCTITAHGADREERPAVVAAEPDALPSVAF